MSSEALMHNQMISFLSQMAEQGGAYPTFTNAYGESGFGQVNAFDSFTRTGADNLGNYSGIAQLALSLSKSLGLVPSTYAYMPQGMPFSYGIDAYEARRLKGAGYAQQRQNKMGDLFVKWGEAAARGRGEQFTAEGAASLRERARTVDMGSALFESMAPGVFESLFGPTGSGLALYDTGYRLASYRTKSDGTMYDAQDSVRYAQQFMGRLHDKRSLLNSREMAAGYSHLQSHGLVQLEDDSNIRFSDVSVERLEREAQEYLLSDEARNSYSATIREASRDAIKTREINDAKSDVRHLYEQTRDPSATKEQRKRAMTALTARREELRRLADDEIKGAFARMTEIQASDMPEERKQEQMEAWSARQQELKRFTADASADSDTELQRLNTMRTRLDAGLASGDKDRQDIFSRELRASELGISEQGDASLNAFVNTVRERVGQLRGGSAEEKTDEKLKEALRGISGLKEADDKLLTDLTKVIQQSAEEVTAADTRQISDLVGGFAETQLDKRIQEQKVRGTEAFIQSGEFMSQIEAPDLTQVTQIQETLMELSKDPAFRAFVRNGVGLDMAMQQFDGYKRGLEKLKNVLTSPNLSPEQIAKLYTSFSGGAAFAMEAEEINANIGRAYGIARQLGYGDSEIQARFAQSGQMAQMTGVNRQFVPWHGTESMAYDLANHRLTAEDNLQGVWGAANLNEVAAKQSQVVMGFVGSQAGNVLGAGLRARDIIARQHGEESLQGTELGEWLNARRAGQGSYTFGGETSSVRISESDLTRMVRDGGLDSSVNVASLIADRSQNQRALYARLDTMGAAAMGEARTAITQSTVNDFLASAEWKEVAALPGVREAMTGVMESVFDSRTRRNELAKIEDPELKARAQKDPMVLLEYMMQNTLPAVLREQGVNDQAIERAAKYMNAVNMSSVLDQYSFDYTGQGIIPSIQAFDPEKERKKRQGEIIARSLDRKADIGALIGINPDRRDVITEYLSGEISWAEFAALAGGATGLTEEDRVFWEEVKRREGKIQRVETKWRKVLDEREDFMRSDKGKRLLSLESRQKDWQDLRSLEAQAKAGTLDKHGKVKLDRLREKLKGTSDLSEGELRELTALQETVSGIDVRASNLESEHRTEIQGQTDFVQSDTVTTRRTRDGLDQNKNFDADRAKFAEQRRLRKVDLTQTNAKIEQWAAEEGIALIYKDAKGNVVEAGTEGATPEIMLTQVTQGDQTYAVPMRTDGTAADQQSVKDKAEELTDQQSKDRENLQKAEAEAEQERKESEAAKGMTVKDLEKELGAAKGRLTDVSNRSLMAYAKHRQDAMKAAESLFDESMRFGAVIPNRWNPARERRIAEADRQARATYQESPKFIEEKAQAMKDIERLEQRLNEVKSQSVQSEVSVSSVPGMGGSSESSPFDLAEATFNIRTLSINGVNIDMTNNKVTAEGTAGLKTAPHTLT